MLSLSYQIGTTFSITYDIWDQITDEFTNERTLEAGDSIRDVEDDEEGWTYYYDDTDE